MTTQEKAAHREPAAPVRDPVAAREPVVALVDAASPVERTLIGNWIADGGLTGPVVQLDLDAKAVATRLIPRHDDPVVVPVRVLWLPEERKGVRRATFGDLAWLSNPRNPHRLMQRWIVRNAPDRYRILTGQPAKLSELRARNPAVRGTALARAIVRAGVLALERAERGVIGDRYKVPRMVAEEILDSPTFRKRLAEIADAQGLSYTEAARRGESALAELVAGQSRLATDLFTQAMRPVHSSAWKVDADESGLAELRELNHRHPLVFLPSHRSYVDPLVLGDVLARNDFPPNHTVGGANLGFWPLGSVARRTGTIFIRRSFGDDEIYKAAVEEYFAYLLAKRFNLEWYFEGGRTRTGKLRPPRYGLLNYLAAAVRTGRVPDVVLVPVSITYERLNELGAIASEQLGATKKAEGLAWMAKYIRTQQHSAGHVYVRFGEPLFAREQLAAHGDPLIPPGNSAEADELERAAVQRLAFDVAVGINRVTPVTVNSLVTLALLGVEGRALTYDEVRGVIAPVLGYIERRGLPSGELAVLRDDQGLAAVLEQLSAARVVTIYRDGVEPVYSIETGQHLIAAFYRNSGVHWFVNRALLELAVLDATESGFTEPLRESWDAAHRLRDLLKFEFFFPSRETFEAEMTAEMLLVDPEWNERAPGRDELLARLTDTGFMMAHRALRSFFDAQLVVAERLAAHDPDAPVDQKAFITECVAVGQQLLLQARLHSPESVSTELFSSALKLAANRGLLRPGAPELAARRQEFATELRTVGERVSLTAALDPSNRKDWLYGPR